MPSSDFNGDGLDDILWRHTNGTISNWLSSGNGTFTVNDANAYASVGNDWVVVGAGDSTATAAMTFYGTTCSRPATSAIGLQLKMAAG